MSVGVRLSANRLKAALMCASGVALCATFAVADELKGYGAAKTGLRPVFEASDDCPEITSFYGSLIDLDGSLRDRPHEGIDLGVYGSEVLAPADGAVLGIWKRTTSLGSDHSVLIAHSAEDLGLVDPSVTYLSEFDHLAQGDITHLAKGMKIARGQQIGLVRHPFGDSRFQPEVHWEVYEVETGSVSDITWEEAADGSTAWWNEAATLIDPLYLFAQSDAERLSGQIGIRPFPPRRGEVHVGFTYPLKCG